MNKVTKFILVVGAFVAIGISIYIARHSCKTLSEGLGFVASTATLIGLVYTAIQIWETKTLTGATRDATNTAISELRANEYRNALLVATRLLGEIRTYLQEHNWRIAAVRLHDMADQCLALARIRPGVDDQWRGYSKVVRWWGAEFESARGNRQFQYNAKEWQELYQCLWDKIDKESQPFVQNDTR